MIVHRGGPNRLMKYARNSSRSSRNQSGRYPPGAVARCGPGVAASGQVRVERLAARGADAGPLALVAMRKHDEAAIPVRRDADQVVGASKHPLIAARQIGSASELGAENHSEDRQGDKMGAAYHRSVSKLVPSPRSLRCNRPPRIGRF